MQKGAMGSQVQAFFLMHEEQQYSKTVETCPSSHGSLSASTDLTTIFYIKHYATIYLITIKLYIRIQADKTYSILLFITG